jgi:hypothetical protein
VLLNPADGRVEVQVNLLRADGIMAKDSLSQATLRNIRQNLSHFSERSQSFLQLQFVVWDEPFELSSHTETLPIAFILPLTTKV